MPVGQPKTSLNSFGGFAAGGAVADRRSEPRVHCHKTIRILPANKLEQQQFTPAEMIDCACRAVSIMSEHPMEVGDQFIIKLDLDRARLLIYSVRHCHPVGTRFHVGAEFTGFFAMPASVEPSAILSALLAL